MPTRTPSARNPFVLPAELQGFPLLYRALIRPIREADQREGREFLRRFLSGSQDMYETIADLIASVWDVHDPVTCPEDLLQYLKDIVGFDSEYDYITDRLDTNDLRKLIKLAVPLWKERFSEMGIINVIRLLTGRTAVLYNWFHWRSILDEVFLAEEQQGYDFWIIGGIVSYFDEYHSQLRLMDDGTLDEQLVLDLVSLERVASERIEVAIVDFLDQFDLARDKWETEGGTPATIQSDKTFLIPSGTDERALMACVNFDNYVVMHRFKLSTGATLRAQFYTQPNWPSGAFYVVEVSKQSVILKIYISGTPSTLATFTGAYPLEELWYKLRISAMDEDGDTRIKVYIDGNEVINYLDTTGVIYGDVIVGASGADVYIDNMEIFRAPLRFAEVGPSGVTTSANFFWDKSCP